jgi:hypothetical protein
MTVFDDVAAMIRRTPYPAFMRLSPMLAGTTVS